MSRAPSMPLFCGDFMADTASLSMEALGCYTQIICATWRRNADPFPDDDHELARLCRLTPTRWRAIRPALVRFFDIGDGTWRQKRLEKEWEFVSNIRAKNSDAGKRSAEARSRKINEVDSTLVDHTLQRNGQRNGNPHPHPHPHPHQEGVPSTTESLLGETEKGNPSDSVESQFEVWWAIVPKKVGKPAALKAFKAARKSTAFEVLLAGIQRFRNSAAGKDPQYIAHPTTWLNQRRWEDDTGSGGGQENSAAIDLSEERKARLLAKYAAAANG